MDNQTTKRMRRRRAEGFACVGLALGAGILRFIMNDATVNGLLLLGVLLSLAGAIQLGRSLESD